MIWLCDSHPIYNTGCADCEIAQMGQEFDAMARQYAGVCAERDILRVALRELLDMTLAARGAMPLDEWESKRTEAIAAAENALAGER